MFGTCTHLGRGADYRREIVTTVQQRPGGDFGPFRPLGSPPRSGASVLSDLSAPAPAVDGSGRLAVFVRGGDLRLYQIEQDAKGEWSGWSDLGGVGGYGAVGLCGPAIAGGGPDGTLGTTLIGSGTPRWTTAQLLISGAPPAFGPDRTASSPCRASMPSSTGPGLPTRTRRSGGSRPGSQRPLARPLAPARTGTLPECPHGGSRPRLDNFCCLTDASRIPPGSQVSAVRDLPEENA